MATIKYNTDASQSVRAQKQLTAAQEEYNKSAEETTKKLTKAERAAKRLSAQADPTENYKNKMLRLAEAVEKGGLSHEKAQRLALKYTQQLDRAGDAGRRSFGAPALANLAAYAAGFLSVNSAIGLVRQGLQQIEQQNQAVADSFSNGLGVIGELQQISATPEDFLKNLGFARSLVSRGVFKDVGSATEFTIAATNAGFSDAEKDELAAIGEKKQVRPEGLIGFGGSIRKVQNFFGGGISLTEAADKITAASGFTQANITQTAQATPILADTIKRLGFDPTEGLALLVAAEEALPNIDEAKTAAAAYLAEIEKKGLSTGTLGGTTQAIQDRIAGGENLYDILGNKRAVRGFSALVQEASAAEYSASIEAIRNASGTLAGRDFLDSDPITSAASEKESAEGRLAARLERDTAERELLLDAVRADVQANTNGGILSRAGEYVIAGGYDLLGAEDSYLRFYANRVGAADDVLSPALGARLLEYLERIADNTQNNSSSQAE